MMTRKPIWRQRLSHEQTSDLETSLGIRDIEYYYRRRTLNWIGKLVSMPDYRLPRQLLHSWASAKKKKGRPQMSVRTAHANLLADSCLPDKTIRGVKGTVMHAAAWKCDIEKIALNY